MIIKRIIYRENGERKQRDFDVGAHRVGKEIREDKEKAVEATKFSKQVEYLIGVYVEETKTHGGTK